MAKPIKIAPEHLAKLKTEYALIKEKKSNESANNRRLIVKMYEYLKTNLENF